MYDCFVEIIIHEGARSIWYKVVSRVRYNLNPHSLVPFAVWREWLQQVADVCLGDITTYPHPNGVPFT